MGRGPGGAKAGLAGLQSWVVKYFEKKWRWAGKIGKMTSERWARRLTVWRDAKSCRWNEEVLHSWRPKRKAGRPHLRWEDALVKFIGEDWMQLASSDSDWQSQEDSFVQFSLA